VIVDETSMVDFAMMARLVDAVRGATRLVLLGDRHQLASVEAGTVLADLCGPVDAAALQASPDLRAALASYDVPFGDAVVERPTALPDAVVQLNRTYRFKGESSIGRFAMACLASDFDAEVAAAPLFAGAADAHHFAPGDGRALPAPVLEAIVDAYVPAFEHLDQAKSVAPADEPAFHRHTLDLFDRFRVLCAHKRGALGVEGVNAAVRQALAERGRSTNGTFWTGRPILVRRNDYDVGLYNGDIGLVVTRRDAEGNPRTFVAFPGPDALPKEGAPPSDAQLVRYVLPARLPEHDTCFALTIHKSQGSEYDHVMVVLPARPSRIVTRELLYTGVTRAKAKVSLVAERDAFVKALKETVQRASGLRDALWGA
ncbi:MAG: ATP-binding domain-containing protein, partial [Myxococcales bacterium]|nr:ATP-binding domain-containing protein [Myxococcales bacterium]